MTEWFADDGFWDLFFEHIFPPARLEAGAAEVDILLDLTDFGGSRILDLACGPGRHSVALAQKGFEVTGVDLSPSLVSRARSLAEKQAVEVEWVLHDMRTFRRSGQFDLCLCMFSSFGYFGGPQDDLSVLRTMHENLAPGGVCVIDVTGKEWLARTFKPTSSWELTDGSLLVERRQIVDDWTRVRNQWTRVTEGEAHEYRFEHAVYSGQELRSLLHEAEFTDVRLFGSLAGEPYGLESQRLIALGLKGV